MDSSLANPARRATQNIRSQKSIEANAFNVLHDGGDGLVRVKFVVSKQQLKQMVAAMARDRTSVLQQTPAMEQLLRVLRPPSPKKKTVPLKAQRSKWRPELQGIPEELSD